MAGNVRKIRNLGKSAMQGKQEACSEEPRQGWPAGLRRRLGHLRPFHRSAATGVTTGRHLAEMAARMLLLLLGNLWVLLWRAGQPSSRSLPASAKAKRREQPPEPGRLRVLVVTSEAPPIVSGISRCVDQLTVGLQARGHHVDVISSVQVARVTLGEWRFSSLLLHLPRIARDLDRYDVINLHGPVPTMSDVALLFSRLLPRSRRIPIVYTHHSALQIRGIEPLCALYNRLHRRIATGATMTMATSRPYQQIMQVEGGPPVRLAPWGVDLRPAPARRERRDEPLKVLFVGQMRTYKGVDCLLQALVGEPAVELTLIGTGPHLEEYQELAAQLGGGNVAFAGHVTDEELHTAYDTSDVVVLPSVTEAEAFGLVVLEGMSAGCVPVVSDLPGVRDLVDTDGLVVTPRDVEGLRAAVLGLAEDRDELAAMRVRARHRAEMFSWDVCIAIYERAFRDVTGTTAVPMPRPAVYTPVPARHGQGPGSKAAPSSANRALPRPREADDHFTSDRRPA